MFLIIALMFMYVVDPPARGVMASALFAASTTLPGPTAMLGSAGVVTAALPDPAAAMAACSLRPCSTKSCEGAVPGRTPARRGRAGSGSCDGRLLAQTLLHKEL